MTNRQEAKLKMYNEAHAVLERYKADVESNVVLKEEVAKFKTGIDRIEALHPRQEVDNKGITTSKDDLREDMVEQALVLAGILFSYGTHNNNADLCERMDLYPTDLNRASIPKFKKMCTEILTECENAGDKIVKYGGTPELIGKFKEDTDIFKKASTNPRDAVVGVSAATISMADLFAIQEETLNNHIDLLMLQFLKKNPTFFNEYQHARIVQDHGSRSKKNAKDTTVSGNPVQK